MRSFSFDRFLKAFRWLLSVNQLVLLGMSFGCAVSMFLLEMVTLLPHSEPSQYVRNVAGFMTFAILVLPLVYVSLMFTSFTHIGSKQQRTNFLMLPASNLEKFLALMACVTFVCLVITTVSLILGDLLRMGVLAAWNQFHPLQGVSFYSDGDNWVYTYWSSALPNVWNNLMPKFITTDLYHFTLSYQVMYVLTALLWGVWVHSSYALVGSLLRKYAFVVTTLIQILCVMLFVYVMQTSGTSLFPSVWRDDQYVSLEVGAVAYVLCVLFIVFSCFNYWASFRIFKHFELISNKWTNYDILKR